VQAKWTNAILDEMAAALRRNRPDIPAARLDRLRDLMNRAVRDCLVLGYEPLIEGLKLPDPDDRHVLAAAIKAGAQVIVTLRRAACKNPLPNAATGGGTMPVGPAEGGPAVAVTGKGSGPSR